MKTFQDRVAACQEEHGAYPVHVFYRYTPNVGPRRGSRRVLAIAYMLLDRESGHGLYGASMWKAGVPSSDRFRRFQGWQTALGRLQKCPVAFTFHGNVPMHEISVTTGENKKVKKVVVHRKKLQKRIRQLVGTHGVRGTRLH